MAGLASLDPPYTNVAGEETVKGWMLSGIFAVWVLVSAVFGSEENQQLADQISSHLAQSGRVHNYRIGIRTQEGVVTVRGACQSQEDVERAIEVISAVPGVLEVVNELKVDPSLAPSSEETAALEAAISVQLGQFVNEIAVALSKIGEGTADPPLVEPELPVDTVSDEDQPAQYAFEETKEGPCSISQGWPFDRETFTLEFGNRLKAECRLCAFEFAGGREAISAAALLENTSDRMMYCAYYIAFFDDEKKLIGCASQSLAPPIGLPAGQNGSLGSCLVWVPEGSREKITSYKLAFYESDRAIGPSAKRRAPMSPSENAGSSPEAPVPNEGPSGSDAGSPR